MPIKSLFQNHTQEYLGKTNFKLHTPDSSHEHAPLTKPKKGHLVTNLANHHKIT